VDWQCRLTRLVGMFAGCFVARSDDQPDATSDALRHPPDSPIVNCSLPRFDDRPALSKSYGNNLPA
jgi:hypothetical protein